MKYTTKTGETLTFEFNIGKMIAWEKKNRDMSFLSLLTNEMNDKYGNPKFRVLDEVFEVVLGYNIAGLKEHGISIEDARVLMEGAIEESDVGFSNSMEISEDTSGKDTTEIREDL